jgi:hypothetical protein
MRHRRRTAKKQAPRPGQAPPHDPRRLAEEYVTVVERPGRETVSARSPNKVKSFRHGKAIAREALTNGSAGAQEESIVVALHATSEKGALIERVEAYRHRRHDGTLGRVRFRQTSET